MRSEDLPEVRATPLFRDIAEETFAALARGAYVQTFPPAIDLIREGEPADFLHVVISGCVEMTASWKDRETTLTFVGPNETFILAATIKDLPNLMSARTMERSRIVLLPSEDVRDAFETDGRFARAVVDELARSYRVKVRALKNMKLRTGLERVAAYMMNQRETGGDRFDLSLEKRRLAAYLGMTPENLSRAFGGLRAYGLGVEGSSVTIGDPEALRRLARPTLMLDEPEDERSRQDDQ